MNTSSVLYRCPLALFLALPLAACSDGDRDVELTFQAMVGTEVAACGKSFTGVGTTLSTFTIKDFKMYVSDVVLLDRRGAATPLRLDQDERWQRDDVALLDFEDGTGGCSDEGTPETNLTIRGVAPSGEYTGVRFSIGLPEALNHLDAATAPAPLNSPGMWWSWKGGYKYVRLDVETRGNPAYYLHLGATACDGDSIAGYSCAAGNIPRIELQGMDLDRSAIELDVAKLWADVDLDRQIDLRSDFVPGCMAFPGDPECPMVFSRLGMTPSGEVTDAQSVFTAGASR
jgi:uncharacterized repeat protein (TIGR04052 family)